MNVEPSRSSGSSRRWILLAVAAGVVLVVLGALYVVDSGPDPTKVTNAVGSCAYKAG